MVREQYGEADRIRDLRGWGGAQPHGNDRYQYSLEQEAMLSAALPGAELLRPSRSMLYRIGSAMIYPKRYGHHAEDCPTTAHIDVDSDIQVELANGRFHEEATLFDLEPIEQPTVVWLLFTGNHAESGPLAIYVAMAGGLLPDGRVDWTNIEPLLDGGGDNFMDAQPARPVKPIEPASTAEPTLKLALKP